MKINIPGLYRIETAEYANLHTQFQDILLNNYVVYEKIKDYFDNNYMNSYKIFSASFNKKRKSVLSESILKASNARGKVFMYLCKIIRANINGIDINMSESAKKINMFIDKCGRLTHKSFNTQSALIDALLLRLENEYKSDAQTLNLDKYIEQLRTENDKFKDLLKKRIEENTKKITFPVKFVRKTLDKEFKTLCSMLETFAITENSKEFEQFIIKFNAILKRVNVRKGKKCKDNNV